MASEWGVRVEVEKGGAIRTLVGRVVDYLAENPPTLGHGFSHLVLVARAACKLAGMNSLQLAEMAYITGLMHDLYRPARGEAGQEEHEGKAAEVAGELLAGSHYEQYGDQIRAAISDHDKRVLGAGDSLLDKVLSIADKSEMSFQRAVAYSWASNKHAKTYSSFLETIRDFSAYQVKAWKVFLAVGIKGVDLGIRAYLQTDRDLIEAVEGEVAGKISYDAESVRIATKEAEQEVAMLGAFQVEKAKIKKVCAGFAELV